jgi:hypothetical protein
MLYKNPTTCLTCHRTISMAPFIVVLQLFSSLYERVEGTYVSQLSMEESSWGAFWVFCQKKIDRKRNE